MYIKCLYICGLCCVKSIVKTRKKPLLFLLLLLLFFIEFYKKIFLLWSHFHSLLLLLLPWLVFIVMLCALPLPLPPPFVHCWWISAHAACHVNEKKQRVEEEEARDKERRVKKHQLTFWLMCVLLLSLLPLTFLINLNTNKHTRTHTCRHNNAAKHATIVRQQQQKLKKFAISCILFPSLPCPMFLHDALFSHSSLYISFCVCFVAVTRRKITTTSGRVIHGANAGMHRGAIVELCKEKHPP